MSIAPRRLLPFAVLALALAPLLGGHGVAEEAPAAPTGEVLALIDPRPGEVVADLGCGRGAWTFPLARAVGAQGRVLAVDIDPEALRVVEERRKAEKIENIEVIQSRPDDPLLPAGALDAVFLNDVIDYVRRDALVGFLAGVRESLKPQGRLVIRDPNGHPDRVIAECYRAGFALVEAKVPLPRAPARAFSSEWYALKLRRGERRHAILPRQGRPKRYRTRLHIAEELFRAGLIPRAELRATWERIASRGGGFDPAVDEPLELLRAAEALDVLPAARIKALRTEIKPKR